MSSPDTREELAAVSARKVNAYESVDQRRIWLLLVLGASEHAGISPLPVEQLHRFAYLANCLAPVYDLPAADGKILKYKRGPFYPNLQWDLDRLWASGLVERRGAQAIQDQLGWWFVAEYMLTAAGFSTLGIIRQSPRQFRMAEFLTDLARAYAFLTGVGRADAALADATYADKRYPIDSVIDFGEWNSTETSNRSFATAEAFDQVMPEGRSLSDRDRLSLYLRHLDRLVARRAG
jgi:hypothetical protein